MAVPHDELRLFDQCKACIICSKDLPASTAHQLAATFESHGGESVIYEAPATFPQLEEFTHLISLTIDFPAFEAAHDALIPVVKPQWVHSSLSKRKLANPRQFSPDPRLFLSDVVVCCGDIPEGDKDAILGGVVAKGGLYTSRLHQTVTHLVDLTTNSDKARLVLSRKLNIKIVLPHWFDDCLKLGRRIDERPYTLPDPEILRAAPDAPIRSSDNKDIVGASTPEPKSLPTPVTSPLKRPKLDVFAGKQIMLSTDLGIGSHLLNSITEIIEEGGGSVVSDVAKADILICRYREGVAYRIASRLNKDVGNLSWLYHLMTYNTWTSPYRRMLHYPVSRTGIPGFKGLKISLSNYVGEARVYLENLIAATGAECTKTLREENTHLVTAHGQQREMQKKKNHTNKKESAPKKASSNKAPRLDSEVTAPANETPRAVNKSRKVSDNKNIQTPARARLLSEGKENETPSSTSSRKSKDAAAARLHEIAPDIALYEKEMKRVGGVIYGGRRKTDEDRITLDKNSKKRRSASPEEEDDEAIEAKRQKKSKPPVVMRLLITGYQKWVGNLKREDTDKRQLRELGIQVVQDARKCTHLAAPSILRTPKFVNGLAYGPMIIRADYVTACLKKNELLDAADFILKDEAAEKRFGFSLEKAKANAKKNKNQLLRGYHIYCVESIRGGFEAFKSIVDANGGDCSLFRGRVSYQSQREESDDDSSVDENPGRKEMYLLSSVMPDQIKTWPKFRQMALGMGKTPRIVRVDWLLDIAMSQELRNAEGYELNEDMADQVEE
ncbi:conserved hypothetical protein [Aspergillus terreus NIH2624]|uniref:BRCT domain-containing protein n=1 Tax=Aspergillus terreus (strain NIH 2624 / FGSC A1156) TaxID=341663 RepID=Q0CT69_ASPTN|nr:uncharacterized protein ATEG_03115 [Aspergillus terreus NIH2624]EAU36389.1 conserved hypothetical protein [Aspergillus terreus NIH2624]